MAIQASETSPLVRRRDAEMTEYAGAGAIGTTPTDAKCDDLVKALFKKWDTIDKSKKTGGEQKYQAKRTSLFDREKGLIVKLARQMGISRDARKVALFDAEEKTHIRPQLLAVIEQIPEMQPYLQKVIDRHVEQPGYRRREACH